MKEYKPGQEKLFCKGRLLYVENGYLRNDQFKGTDGKEKNRVKIMINAFEILNDAVEVSKEIPKVDLAEKENPWKQCATKPTDAVSKISVTTSGSTHPSDLPPPVMNKKKEDVSEYLTDTDEEIPF
jgi:single-stranded DNA-binding protein